ncbi:MAG: LLM class flavin-dependent oxidoreductase [Chloroflexota bacterium]
MQVGIGLPATIPSTSGGLVLEWARRADGGPFDCLGILDRVVYDNYESMTTLAAVAAVTQRITLASVIVIAPLRATALLGKQAATVQAISGGRLVLGVGLGAREDDYAAVGAEYRNRGRRLTNQLFELREQWEEEKIGPLLSSSRPRLLVGGAGGLAQSRMARYADGYVHGGGTPRAFARATTEARAAWTDMGRPADPELWGMAYFQLGGDSELGSRYLKEYYAFTGPFADRIAAGLLTTAGDIAEFLRGYDEAGCDHLVLFPTVADIQQLDRLALLLTGG